VYSSVVGQQRLRPHTDDTDGFQVTSERERYANRLNACTSFSNIFDAARNSPADA